MKKLGLTTLISLAVNVILGLWLVNQYFYDTYFRLYVDNSLGPVYPFIVLTAGLGGGSSLGYLLLRRRHAGDGTGRLEKAKLFKSGGPVQTPGSASAANRVMPTGPPPGQVSRHTAYAVPPLPKSSSSSGTGRSATPSAISIAAKASTSLPPPPQRESVSQPSTSILNSTLRDQFKPDQGLRSPSSSPQPFPPGRVEGSQPINRVPPEPSRMSFPGSWKSEPGQRSDRGPDSTVFPKPSSSDLKPGMESQGFGGGSIGQPPKPPQPSQTPFPVSKWVPPDQRGESQWTDPVPKPGLAAPQKWAAPPGQSLGPRPPQGVPMRPGPGPPQGPGAQRPPFPPGQGGPRPIGFPNPPRPGQPAPIGVVPSFRPDQPRPAGAPIPGRPPSMPGGSGPPSWTPPKPAQRQESGGFSPDKDLGGTSGSRPPLGTAEGSVQETRPIEPSSSGGEMDWDTALDTILKTLKKDRGVGEKT